jgi:hypothetical protein
MSMPFMAPGTDTRRFPAVLSADQEAEAQREVLRQSDVVRAKNMSIAATEPGKPI